MIQPDCANPRRKAASRASRSVSSAGEPLRKPMRRTSSCCCARAASGQAAAAPPSRNSRRCIGYSLPAETRLRGSNVARRAGGGPLASGQVQSLPAASAPDVEGRPWRIRCESFQLRRASDPVAFGLRYQSRRVFEQQITVANQRVGSLLYCGYIRFLGRVALLDRWACIAHGKPFGLGTGERDKAALQRAKAVLEEAAVEQVPAGIRANRDFHEHVADAADVIAVGVD